MSLANTARAMPTLVRVGVMGAVAYRAELFVWMLSTTMPFVMLAMYSAVAREGQLAGFGGDDFVIWSIATFVVRQFTGSWASWQINEEVRSGTLSMRLLRPISPIVNYAVENLAAMPLRMIIAVPLSVGLFIALGTDLLPHDLGGWLAFFAAWFGAWLLTFTVHVIMGALSFWLEQSMKVMNVWFAGYLVFSGYLIPVSLFPAGFQQSTRWLPFFSQIGLPVELLTKAEARADAGRLLAVQWGWIVLAMLIAAALWRRGVRRYGAVGG